MTLQSCLDGIVAGNQQWLASADVSLGRITVAFLAVGLLVAAAASPLAATSYTRSMKRFMAMREVADAPPAWRQRRTRRTQRAVWGKADCTLTDAVRNRERRMRRATWCAYSCFVVCGLPAVWMYEDRSASSAAWVLAYLALMALGPALVNLRAHHPGRAIWLVPFVLAAISLSGDSPASGIDVLYMTLLLLSLQLVGVHRTLRAVTGPLMVVCSAPLIVVVAFDWSLPIEHCVPGSLFKNPSWAAMSLFEMMFALGIAAYAAAIALLRLIEHLIDVGWASDLSLVAASGLMVVAWLLLALADGKAVTGAQLTAYFAAWIGATAAAYALALRAQPCPQIARSLLVLRVFSTDRRAERMLDALQTRWRLVGPVLEIGGPDLARLNLDLHEVLKLFSFRLPELLHPRGLSNAELTSSLDLAIDREGRFRVNEVFCFDSSWKAMAERLMRISDVVLLDLRGFNPQRGGTTHEVLRLAAIGALDRVVVVYDEHTDWKHYKATVGNSGAPASAEQLPVRRFDAAQVDALQQCFAALLAIAARPCA